MGAAWVGGAFDPLPVTGGRRDRLRPGGEIVLAALRLVVKGGTLAIAGIWLSPIPALDYERDLFYERNLRSVTANTRADERPARRGGGHPAAPARDHVPARGGEPRAGAEGGMGLNGTGVLVL